ncbi:MAG: FAS1-like dehydratase domain-containing protein [Candidatus Dormibacteria bacterium]
MPTVDESLVGAELPPVTTAITGAAVAAYARAVGETNPVYPDDPVVPSGALVPPAFAAVYALAPPGRELGFGIAPQRLVHGEQAFEWHRAVRVGEILTTTTRVAGVERKRNLQFMIVEATSRDEGGEVVCVSRATILVLPEPVAQV